MALSWDNTAGVVGSGTGNLSWTHTGASSGVKGVVVSIVQNLQTNDQITSVSYGSLTLTRVDGATVFHANAAAGKTGAVYTYVGTTGVPQGAQTVTVTVSASGATKDAHSYTILGSSDLAVTGSNTLDTSNTGGTSASVTITSAAALPALAVGALHSGATAVSGMTAGTGTSEAEEVDFGNQTASFTRLTSVTTGGNITYGWTVTANTAAGIGAVALAESYVAEPSPIAATGSVLVPGIGTGVNGSIAAANGAAVTTDATIKSVLRPFVSTASAAVPEHTAEEVSGGAGATQTAPIAATAAVPVPTLTVSAAVAQASPVAATTAVPVPAFSIAPAIQAVQAAATGLALAASLTIAAFVSPPAATASAIVIQPDGVEGEALIAAVVATATAEIPSPSVTVAPTVSSVVATATGAVLSPSIGTGLTAAIATATGAIPVPSAGLTVNVSGVPATATAAALEPGNTVAPTVRFGGRVNWEDGSLTHPFSLEATGAGPCQLSPTGYGEYGLTSSRSAGAYGFSFGWASAGGNYIWYSYNGTTRGDQFGGWANDPVWIDVGWDGVVRLYSLTGGVPTVRYTWPESPSYPLFVTGVSGGPPWDFPAANPPVFNYPAATRATVPAPGIGTGVSVVTSTATADVPVPTITVAPTVSLATVVPSSPTNYWMMDETTGTRDDAVGSDDLAAYGSPSYTTGILGNAVVTDGASSYLETAALPSALNGTAYSACAWVKVPASLTKGTSHRWLTIYDSVNVSILSLDVNRDASGSLLSFYHTRRASGQAAASASFTVPYSANPYLGNWVHVVWTFDQSYGVTLYVNGKPADSPNTSTAAKATLGAGASIPLRVGWWYSTWWSAVTLDDVRLYSRALTQEEAQALYSGGVGTSLAFIPTAGIGTGVAAQPATATAAIPLPTVGVVTGVQAVVAPATAAVLEPTLATGLTAQVATATAEIPTHVATGTSALAGDVSAVTATATAAVPVHAIGTGLTLVPATATAAALVPSLTIAPTVAAVPATSSGAVLAPALGTGLTAARATATAAVPVPAASVAATQVPTGPATATAAVLVPSLTLAPTVAAAVAPATAQIPTPAVSGISSLDAGVAAASGAALVPKIGTGLTAQTAVATAAVPIPTASSAASISGTVATASAAIPVPTIGTGLTASTATATAEIPVPGATVSAAIDAVSATATAEILYVAIGGLAINVYAVPAAATANIPSSATISLVNFPLPGIDVRMAVYSYGR